ncbi:MAG: class I SAM-dependent methyltransferase [Solirubrobacterales bacterium]
MARPGWHRRAVGGVGPMWDRIADLQLEFMTGAGLRPEHCLLDIGCGSLRGGSRFIPYLDAGHYFGVDRNARLIETGLSEEIDEDVRAEKRPQVAVMEDFGFERLGRRFDFALAQSVFTHLPLNSIMRCLVNVARVLEPDGRCYATFFENPDKRNLDPVEQAMTESFYDADPFHYDVDTLACVCRGTGLELEYVGEWGHPRGQRMLLFTPAGG